MGFVQNYVKLRPEDHTYWDTDGKQYTSMSHVLNLIKPKFDKEKISKLSAAKNGVSQAEMLAKWDKINKDACDQGTRIHDALERYEKSFQIKEEDRDLELLIKSVLSEYSGYHKVFQEECLFDPDYRIAGTTDKICLTSSHKNSVIDISDYKTNKGGITFTDKYKNYLLGPFSHLQNCNYVTYALQLSGYAYMLEKLTGRRIGKLTIMHIPQDNPIAYRSIPVPYMKHEVIALFDYFKKCKDAQQEEEEELSLPLDIQGEPSF